VEGFGLLDEPELQAAKNKEKNIGIKINLDMGFIKYS
jgi:hypothetical protein